jgi:sensor histidine kinase regulating citrate/malate metabolism
MITKQIPQGTKRRMDMKTFFMYLFVPVSSLGIMLVTYYSGINLTGHIFLQSIMVACFASLLLGNILMFYAFNRFSEQMEIGMQQELIITRQNMDIKYFEQVEVLNEKYKEFIHNTNHYLKAIGQLAIGENGSQILDILNDLHIELENNETIVYCKDHTMNAILSERKMQANKMQVIYDAYVEPGFDLCSVTALDLIVMLGNLLDNAITAAKQCDASSKVMVRIFVDEQKSFNIIKIVNDFNGAIKLENGSLKSIKKDKELHGIGLECVKNTAIKYGGYLEYFFDEMKFTAMLILPMS